MRNATLTFTDNAANSPQVLNVYGTGGLAAGISAASNGSTSASISAGQSAQFNLQATPAPGFSGTLSFTCTGVPFVATCTVPANLSVASGVATPFFVTITTTAASSLPLVPTAPSSPLSRPAPPLPAIQVSLFSAILLFLLMRRTEPAPLASPRATFSVALPLLLTVTLCSGIACGGGSGSASAPQQQSPASQTTATPTLQPAGGVISTGFPSVVITDATPGSTIYYTTDGSAPTASSPVYTAAFTVNVPATVQAFATASSYSPSAVASASYKFQTPSGTSTILLSATAVATGSSKQLQLSPIQLSLAVK